MLNKFALKNILSCPCLFYLFNLICDILSVLLDYEEDL